MKREAYKALIVAIFFSIGFSIIILHNRLLTAGSGIQIASFARALIGGLVVAKVLLTVDMLPFVHAFPQKPLAYNIGWKSSIYVAAGVGFLYTEPFLKHLFKGMSLSASHSLAWQELLLPRTWATVIWLAVLLMMFVTMQELSRVIGKDELKYIFFGRSGKPTSNSRAPAAPASQSAPESPQPS